MAQYSQQIVYTTALHNSFRFAQIVHTGFTNSTHSSKHKGFSSFRFQYRQQHHYSRQVSGFRFQYRQQHHHRCINNNNLGWLLYAVKKEILRCLSGFRVHYIIDQVTIRQKDHMLKNNIAKPIESSKQDEEVC